ncbi:MAG: MgtC/SapB family protein [Muribaculaceae bacterium]|nr:MgtC/SapB family protein [Muribaculaceae bacterium]
MSLADYFETLRIAVNSVEVTTVSSIYKLLLSLLLGSVVGYERKKRGQPAGVRTFSLIAMGSTLAMILSIYVPQEYLGLKNGDPGRIAAQVVTGIGFLGAGAIIQMKGSVRGLTTAAGIWMVSAIGMSVGVGMYVVAVISTLLILFILVWLDKVEHKANMGADLRTVRLNVEGVVQSIDPYKKILEEKKVSITRFNIEYNYSSQTTELTFIILIPEGVDALKLLSKLGQLYPTTSLSLSIQTAN